MMRIRSLFAELPGAAVAAVALVAMSPPAFAGAGQADARPRLTKAEAKAQRVALDHALADGFNVGRELGGEPCRLLFRWQDPEASRGVDRSYSISCRGSASSRVVGMVTVRLVGRDPAPVTALYADAVPVTLRDGVAASASQCSSTTISRRSVCISFTRNGFDYRGEAVEAVAGPLEVAMVALANGVVPDLAPADKPSPSFKPVDLPKLADPNAALPQGNDLFNPSIALRYGTRLNREGLYVEASRVMNDTLGRMPADAQPALRVELSLEAALADSNIGAVTLARNRFAAVDDVLRNKRPNTDRLAILDQKYRLYTALDALNRSKPDEALRIIGEDDAKGATAYPLEKRSTLSVLNRPVLKKADASRALTAQEEQRRELILLDIQQDRARSQALLASRKRDVAGAEAALFAPAPDCRTAVSARMEDVVADINPVSMAWLESSLLRQCARLKATKREYGAAADASKAAVDVLMVAAQASGDGPGQPVAEARIEQANYLLKAGNKKSAAEEFKAAVDVIAAASEPLIAPLPGIEGYLDMLIADSATQKADDPAKEFFRVLQQLGTPAIARQTAQIQRVVVSDPAVGTAYRDRLDVDRELRGLIYQIDVAKTALAAATPDRVPARQKELDDLVKVQGEKQNYRDKLTADLASEDLDNSPLGLDDLRKQLKPGEIYFKLTSIPKTKTYGIIIDQGTSSIYATEAPSIVLADLARTLRASAAGTSAERKTYDVPLAATLYEQITGTAANAAKLAKATALIVDGSGPLEILPMGILVTDEKSVDAFMAKQGDDYSHVAFLAAQTKISTALSPRSFDLTRKLPASLPLKDRPLRPFLGLGAPVAPSPEHAEQAANAFVTLRCPTAGQIYRKEIWSMPPISDEGILIAGRALGEGTPIEIVGAEFTDEAVMKRTDLMEYKVIHFATHGLPEFQSGCAEVPPSLVTSVGDPGISDGLLSFEEIANLRVNANLVVLAACETFAGLDEEKAAASGQEAGSTLAGLTNAFLHAQARAVMATYWKVPIGADTNTLIGQFYTSGRTSDIGGSLRDAQAKLIGNPATSHPYFWGAYFVVGDTSKKMLDVATTDANGVATAAR